MDDSGAARAQKIADKYVGRDGKPPKIKDADADPLGPAPTERAEREAAARERARLVFESERDAREKDIIADRALLSKVARVMKIKKNAIGGWQTHPDIIKAVEHWASKMKTQRTMASLLGKTVRAFEEAMHKNKGDNPLRLAYESGRAAAEQRHIDVCETLDPTDSKQVVGWIFYMKAVFGWRDKPDNAESDTPKITFVLPGPMSREEYFKELGITESMDTRPVADRTRQLGGVAVGTMVDVTPGADGKLPTLGAQKVLAGGR